MNKDVRGCERSWMERQKFVVPRLDRSPPMVQVAPVPRSPRILLATLATAATVALLAACGGGEDEGEEFASAADAICVEGAERDLAIQAGQEGSGPEASARFLADLGASRARVATELADLPVADELAEGRDELVASRQRAVDAILAGEQAAQDEDVAAYESSRARARTIGDEGDALAAELGLAACARALPAAERQEIGSLLRLTVDVERAQELCAERATKRFVADRFASVSECVSAQSEQPAADRIEITDLSGTSEVFATAYVELSGPDGSEPLEYEAGLVYEDGLWMLNTLVEVPPASE
jgi:hypothetical protein